MDLGVALAERGLLPEPALRWGIRRVVRARLRQEAARHHDREAALAAWLAAMERAPIALQPAAANAQHYEVPPAFFAQVLGRHLKYSGCYWPPGVATLDDAEQAALELVAARARLLDGQRILDLGCGWGSFSLWAAARLPASRITAVSHSAPQRAFIEGRARAAGLTNLEVITADMNDFAAPGRYDRVVSIEMFEHMRNWPALLERIRGWLGTGGRLFVHVFTHDRYAYPYEVDGADDWMARRFFTGGMMPSDDLLPRAARGWALLDHQRLPGTHYARTAEAWHANLVARRGAAAAALAGSRDPALEYRRWRIFFLACAELFAYGGGREWLVSHYLLEPPP